MSYMSELAMVADMITAFDDRCRSRAAFFSGILEAVPDYSDLSRAGKSIIIDYFNSTNRRRLADMLRLVS